MTPDSLAVELAVVPLTHLCLSPGDRPEHKNCCHDIVDGEVLATTARKWIKAHLIREIERWDKEWGQADEDGLADLLDGITKALGL